MQRIAQLGRVTESSAVVKPTAPMGDSLLTEHLSRDVVQYGTLVPSCSDVRSIYKIGAQALA